MTKKNKSTPVLPQWLLILFVGCGLALQVGKNIDVATTYLIKTPLEFVVVVFVFISIPLLHIGTRLNYISVGNVITFEIFIWLWDLISVYNWLFTNNKGEFIGFASFNSYGLNANLYHVIAVFGIVLILHILIEELRSGKDN